MLTMPQVNFAGKKSRRPPEKFVFSRLRLHTKGLRYRLIRQWSLQWNYDAFISKQGCGKSSRSPYLASEMTRAIPPGTIAKCPWVVPVPWIERSGKHRWAEEATRRRPAAIKEPTEISKINVLYTEVFQSKVYGVPMGLEGFCNHLSTTWGIPFRGFVKAA